MKRLKSNKQSLDRLSALPDSLIHEILSFMKMRDVVRTTLLSKRWKHLWATVPCLEFSVSAENSVRSRNFVSRTLSLWRGTQLRKFSINFSWGSDASSLTSDVDMWVLFAIDRKVEELCISYEYDDCNPKLYSPSQCLYECSSVTKLKLDGCDLQIRRSVQWHRLNSLELSYCRFSDNVISHVFPSSPQLETFESYFNRGFHNLSIRSSSLKKLICTSDDVEDELTICAPKVEALKIRGVAFTKYSLTDVSSLSNVELDFWSLEDGDAMCQILQAIQHVTTVRLSGVCLKILGGLRGKYSFPPLLNVKVLRIGGGVNEHSELLHLFEIFPTVKMLIIDWEFKSIQAAGQLNAYKNYKMSKASNLGPNLLQLKKSEITFYSYWYSSMLQFIEFLLKHATVIEKIVIQTRRYRQLDKSENVLQVARLV